METIKYCVVIKKYTCFHGKQQSRCVPCKGSGICEHNIRRNQCVPCKGSGICEHNIQRNYCVPCKGSSICEHDKQRNKCVPCKGSGICEHNIQRNRCVPCKGSSICEHNIQRNKCKPCKGSSICEHDIQRNYCVPCGGSGICEHDKQRQYCKPCGGSSLCNSSWCHTTKNKKYDGYCVLCYTNLFPDKPISRNYKTKERAVVDFINEMFPQYDWVNDKRIIDGCSKRRPDMLVDLGSHLVIIEVDEFRHDTYTTECEIKRLNDIFIDVGCRPIVMIRFNPDSYKDAITGALITSCWSINNSTKTLLVKKSKYVEWLYRLERLRNEINQSIIQNITEPVNIIELFY